MRGAEAVYVGESPRGTERILIDSSAARGLPGADAWAQSYYKHHASVAISTEYLEVACRLVWCRDGETWHRHPQLPFLWTECGVHFRDAGMWTGTYAFCQLCETRTAWLLRHPRPSTWHRACALAWASTRFRGLDLPALDACGCAELVAAAPLRWLPVLP